MFAETFWFDSFCSVSFGCSIGELQTSQVWGLHSGPMRIHTHFQVGTESGQKMNTSSQVIENKE